MDFAITMGKISLANDSLNKRKPYLCTKFIWEHPPLPRVALLRLSL